MPKWKKGAKEFAVSVNRVGKDVKMTLPKPIDQFLDEPDKIVFRIEKNGKVRIS